MDRRGRDTATRILYEEDQWGGIFWFVLVLAHIYNERRYEPPMEARPPPYNDELFNATAEYRTVDWPVYGFKGRCSETFEHRRDTHSRLGTKP